MPKRELVYQYNKVKLYYYGKKTRKSRLPLLIVFATVNRPDVLDLLPDQSFIHHLYQKGEEVYLLDWGYPEAEDHELDLNHYVSVELHNVVEFILHKQSCKKINLLGICQGGLITLFYSLLYKYINRLILLSTPIDFHTKDNRITNLAKTLQLDTFAHLGNIPGAWLTQFFIALRPLELIGSKYAQFWQNINDQAKTDKFLRVERWLFDAPDQTKAAFFELIRDFYQENKLISDQKFLQGRRIRLSEISVPVLNIIAKEDTIIPPSASKALKKYVAKELYTERTYNTGHIGLYISESVVGKLATNIAAWLK